MWYLGRLFMEGKKLMHIGNTFNSAALSTELMDYHINERHRKRQYDDISDQDNIYESDSNQPGW